MAEKYVNLSHIIETLEIEWGYEGMREDLENLPAADVVIAKNGSWIEDSLVNESVICSLCGYTDYRFNYEKNEWGSNFCPNCGAKMNYTSKERGGEK